VSAAITGIFLFLGGSIINVKTTFLGFLLNLTMLSQLIPSHYGIALLDPSYWTLAIEIKFYVIVFILLLLKQFKRIELFSLIASSALMVAMLIFNMPLTWASYFLAGIFFYKIYRNGLTNWRIYGLCSTFFISLHFALARIPSFEKNFAGTSFSPTIIVLHVLAFYIFFLLVSLNKLKIPNNTYINILGILTYPAYLLHQQIARVLFSYGYMQGIPTYVSLPIIAAFIFILSYGIHKLFETRGRILLNNVLEKIIPTRIKNF
jgi:peptidoglycan/LPS O-acetylase OafA/YrhL